MILSKHVGFHCTIHMENVFFEGANSNCKNTKVGLLGLQWVRPLSRHTFWVYHCEFSCL